MDSSGFTLQSVDDFIDCLECDTDQHSSWAAKPIGQWRVVASGGDVQRLCTACMFQAFVGMEPLTQMHIVRMHGPAKKYR